MDSLDLLAVIMSYVAIKNYEETQDQTTKIDIIINDMEQKMMVINQKLDKLLERSEKNVQEVR